ncbi:MAG: hypothetical protein ACRDTR_10660 [Rubrobacter sp.]
MTTPPTRGLIAAATALSGLVAGTTIDTAIVKLPSWRRLGAEPWAAYTRGELPTSLVWYPVLGIGGVLANLAAAVAVHRDGGVARSAALPSRVVALLAIGHLLTSAKAVPHMVRVRETDDQASLWGALESFRRWNGARAVLDTLTFAANLWSLASVTKS